MKGITKKIATLGLAVTMLGAAVGIAGCAEGTQEDVSSKPKNSYLVSKNTYIVVSENGSETLHKGDVIVPYKDYTYGYVYVFPTILKFNCGKELQTYQFVAYPQGCPSKEKYDVVCDCAYELTMESTDQQSVTLNHECSNHHELDR